MCLRPTPISWLCHVVPGEVHDTQQGAADCIRRHEVSAPYGFCPKCGERGEVRSRCFPPNDTCTSGHVYPSDQAKSAGQVTA